MRHARAAVVLTLIIGAMSANAQALPREEAAHSGIVLTPIGALPQLTRIDLPADTVSRLQVQARYGLWKASASGSRQFQNMGVTALYRVLRRLSLGGTLGYRACGGCDGLMFGSADVDAGLFHQTNERYGEGFIDVSLQGSAGYGRANSDPISAVSAGAWLPVSVSLPEPNGALVSLSFAPGVAYGYLMDDGGDVLGYVGGDGGGRAMFSASFAYLLDGPLGLHASMHRVMLKNSPTHFGFGVTWRVGATTEASRR